MIVEGKYGEHYIMLVCIHITSSLSKFCLRMKQFLQKIKLRIPEAQIHKHLKIFLKSEKLIFKITFY